MVGEIGPFLRQLRSVRGIPLSQLARRALLAERTLRNWESGAYQPRLPELQAALAALNATASDRAQALSLVHAPRARRQLHAQPHMMRLQEELGPIPSVGDLLRAMRQRRQLRLEQVAGQLGVSSATLSRWETARVMPPAEQRERLLHLLQAHPQERLALVCGDLLGGSPLRDFASSPQALEERFNLFLMQTFHVPQDALHDLSYLTFEALAWTLAARDMAGQLLLARIYANHATYLEAFDRLSEARTYAERVLNLMPTQTKPEDTFVRAGIVAAQATVCAGRQPALKRGIEMLELWLPHARGLDYRAWIQSNMAEYLMLSGEQESALRLSAEACRIAADYKYPSELRHRRRDHAKRLLRAGHIDEGLDLISDEPDDTPIELATAALLRAESLLKRGDRAAAEWLHQANVQIQHHNLTHLCIRADTLARQL